MNTFAAWFARDSGLDIKDSTATVQGLDGHETHVRHVSDMTAITANQIQLHLSEALVVDFPPVFQLNRLGGLISPQLLPPVGRAAVLDLRAPSLAFEQYNAAVLELEAASRTKSDGLRTCTNHQSQFVNRQYAARVSVSGVSGMMLIDTGASRTTVSSDSQLAQGFKYHRELDGSHSQGVGGTVLKDQAVANITITVDGEARELKSMLIGSSSSPCGPDGTVGMDFLASCVLVLDDSTAAIKCSRS